MSIRGKPKTVQHGDSSKPMKNVRVTTLTLCLLFTTGFFAFQLTFFPQKVAAGKQAIKIKKCKQQKNFVVVIHGGAGRKEYKLKERAAFIQDLLTL